MSSRMIRLMALVGFVAQVAFVLGWLIAGRWQGRGYSSLEHSISDMYAVTAPRGMFLVVVITLCGIATVLFALLSMWPTLRASGWWAAVASILLALSVYGLGDSLTPFERLACRLADPGCSSSDQVANAGGALDVALTTIGIFVFIGAVFFAAAAMKRTPGFQSLARPARWVGVIFVVLVVGLVASEPLDLGGLMERLVAAFGAAAIAAFAWRIFTTTRPSTRAGSPPESRVTV